jgi:hypothetical protein
MLGLCLGTANAAATRAAVGPTTALYWRLNITAGNGSFVGAREIEFRATAGGADLTSGGTAFATSNFDGTTVAANAFDNNTGTEWASDGSAFPQRIGYQFASPVDIKQVYYAPRTAGFSNQSPTAFNVQSSSDGVNYTTRWSVSGLSWPDATPQIFTAP